MNREKFDSDEEMYFFWWLKELQSHGYINKIVTQPKSFNLSQPLRSDYIFEMKTKIKYVDEELMKGHIYTTDFYVEWNEKAKDKVMTLIDSALRKKKGQSLNILLSQMCNDSGLFYSFIEVKPSFDQNNMTRLAKINQKWVWDKCRQYVNIVIPEKRIETDSKVFEYMLSNS